MGKTIRKKRKMQYIGQQRGLDARLVTLLAVSLAVVVGGLAALAFVDIPATQAPVEKELDAKAFLGSQQ